MSDLSGCKILYLDDDSFFIKVYKDKFAQYGCLIQTATKVDDALQIIRNGFTPDAILFDLQMGEKDGFDFLKILRDEQLAHGASLIALTNNSNLEDKKRALELGTNVYIVKAEKIPEEVVQTVASTLAERLQNVRSGP